MTAIAYPEFLAGKATVAPAEGFDVDPADVQHPLLKPHQRQIVVCAVRGGRRAIFAAFGMGKTVIQLETVRLTLARAGGKALIVCPLGVQQEFAQPRRLLFRLILATPEAAAAL